MTQYPVPYWWLRGHRASVQPLPQDAPSGPPRSPGPCSSDSAGALSPSEISAAELAKLRAAGHTDGCQCHRCPSLRKLAQNSHTIAP